MFSDFVSPIQKFTQHCKHQLMQCLSTCSVSLSGSQYPGLWHSEKIFGKHRLNKINCRIFSLKRFHRLRVLYNSLFLQTVYSGSSLNWCLVSATLPKTCTYFLYSNVNLFTVPNAYHIAMRCIYIYIYTYTHTGICCLI